MTISGLKNKKICLLGLGLENFSLALFLARQGIKSAVLDKRTVKKLGDRCEKLKILGISVYGGCDYLKKIGRFDVIFKSPGFGDKLIGLKGKALVTTPMSLFFDLCPAKIIAVTGTKGKGTVASLCYHILARGNKKVWLAGNIGAAPFDFIEKLRSNHFVILELSSFQLLDFKPKPYISVVTNLFPEHLAPADPINPVYHKNLNDYYKTKANVFLNQDKNTWLVANKSSHHQANFLEKTKAKIIYFKAGDKTPKNQHLMGFHNRENIAAACEVAKILKISRGIIEKSIENFKGLNHHLEFVAKMRGVRFYNDSASTMPAATLAAIGSFKDPVILITGGINKGYDLKQFSQSLARQKHLKSVILIGETSDKIERFFKKINHAFKVYNSGSNVKLAIRQSAAISSKNDIVLFSPGFASFDMFLNSKDRGEKFKKIVLSSYPGSGDQKS